MLKPTIRRLLRRQGLTLGGGPDLLTFLEVHNVDLVLDVGANVGQYGLFLRRLGYTRSIWSFEPIRSVFESLERASAKDVNWKITRTALGAEAGVATLNVSELSVFSSIKQLSEDAHLFDSRVNVIETQQVPVTPLNSILDQLESQSIFLKVDTQGFEREVLEGARRLRPRLVGIQLEVPVDNLYGDTWDFFECMEFMCDYGFLPAQFSVVNVKASDKASALEFDCIFRPK